MIFAMVSRGGWMVLPALLMIAAPGQLEAQDPNKIYTLAEVTAQPKLKSENAAAQAINRNYPDHLRAVGGRVQLKFVVRSNGRVDPETIEVVVASASQLGEAASRAIQQIEFQPGQVNGVPVNSEVVFPITYAAR